MVYVPAGDLVLSSLTLTLHLAVSSGSAAPPPPPFGGLISVERHTPPRGDVFLSCWPAPGRCSGWGLFPTVMGVVY